MACAMRGWRLAVPFAVFVFPLPASAQDIPHHAEPADSDREVIRNLPLQRRPFAQQPPVPLVERGPSAMRLPPLPQKKESSSLAAAFALRPSLRSLPADILRDQRDLWLSPLRIRRQHVGGLLLTGGITGVLLASDRPIAQSIVNSPPGAGYDFGRLVGKYTGGNLELATVGGFYLAGRLSHNERARATGVLGLRAVLDSLMLVQGLKWVTQRTRPTRRDLRPLEGANGEFLEGGNSFPSGHASAGWALAVVVARQYQHRRWVPPLAYGLAGVVAFSRIPARKHFPSDVFIGSLVGFHIGRRVWRSAQDGGPEGGQRLQFAQYTPQGGGFGMALLIAPR